MHFINYSENERGNSQQNKTKPQNKTNINHQKLFYNSINISNVLIAIEILFMKHYAPNRSLTIKMAKSITKSS